jgi:pyruvate kinase
MLRIPGYQPGDTVVIITGSPPNQSGSTNLIRVHRLSHNSEPMQVLGIQRGPFSR